MAKEVVHFTIGEDMGIRLMEIAQEHLTMGNDPVKALKAITDSLIGCPTDYALKILKGDVVLFADVENQTIIPVDRDPAIHDRLFPKVDVLQFMTRHDKEIEKHRMNLVASWRMLENEIRKNRNVFRVDFDYDDIFKFIAGNDDVILEHLKSLDEYNHIESLIKITKNFIERSSKIQDTMEWMSKTWNDFDEVSGSRKNNPWIEYTAIKENITDNLMDVMSIMQSVMNLNFRFEPEDDEVKKYLSAVMENDKILSEGIQPVDIMDNYSAGWLSPEGEFYGLNGEIANMLHNQIADSLVEAGIIPEDEASADAWLEQQGWVKIHDNNINYGGCLNHHIGLENVHINEEQVLIIANYIKECHNGLMRLGWKLQRVTATMFVALFKSDLHGLNKNYFEF